ncbi:signal peptide peptidase [Pseudomonas phage PMBT3]|uniref:Signal peptide peptidase n=1 Tax=Pseudomonas phage PMBT3 TaxID=2059856 RepID=A0A2I6PHS0_9CAUD|nr:signal peptide peptidase [Pseudomonas phage PMBT3]AUM59605.1 signal peptide peptidase [Pseudomonas phage PMBT3]
MAVDIWLGTEKAFNKHASFELKYKFDKDAYSNYPFDDREEDLCPVFGVDINRKGLYLLDKVGETPVLKIHGSLVPSYRRYHQWYPGEVTSYEAINDALAILGETGHTDVILDHNSGGGAVSGLDTVTTNIERLQADGMNFRAHTDSASFSASYWIMSSANSVTASKMAEVGSIGVIAVIRTLANTEENYGVKFTVLKEGEFKAVGNPYEELSEADKKYLQENLKETNAFFLNHISAQRNLSLDDYKDWADGKTFFAAKAVKNGLVDRITTLNDLIGRGASAHTTGDRRKFEMKISPEKLAQIEAGANAADVLTKAELAHYTKEMADLKEAADKEAAAQKVLDDAEAEKLAKEAADKEAADKLAADKLAGVTGTTGTIDAAAYTGAIKEAAKLEIKVEDLTEKLAKAETALAEAQSQTASLVIVAQQAVKKLQVATGRPQVEKSSPTEILAQFNELQTTLASMFKIGQQTDDVPTKDANEPVVNSNVRHKVVSLNAGKK